MDKYTLQALNNILEYMYDDESKSFDEADNEDKKNHIFNDIQTVAGWVDIKMEQQGLK